MLIPLILACVGTQTIIGDTAPDNTAPDNTATDTGETPRDIDEDGYPAGEDCMDLNAAVNPGATEVWNGLDDDCDGVFDADGEWGTTALVEARAVYEGRPYSFSLDCPFAGTRGSGSFDWLITCTPDPDDEDAQRLLGASFTLTPEEAAVELDEWEGKAVLESSAGWDTRADATILWSSFERAAFVASLSAASLSMGAEATLKRD